MMSNHSSSMLQLPSPRGPVSEVVLNHLKGGGASEVGEFVDSIDSEDLNVALYVLCSAEVCRYGGVDLRVVDDAVSRSTRTRLLAWYERALGEVVSPVDQGVDSAVYVDHVLARPSPGAVDPSDWLMWRAPYLLHEADAHTMAMARAEPAIQQVVAELQAGEYGVGYRSTHASIYRKCLESIVVEPHDAVDQTPGPWLAAANLPWLFASAMRFRSAALGQLALFELDSVEPCRRFVERWDAAGLPEAGRRWFDVHALADVEHERLVRQRLLPLVAMFDDDEADAFRFGVEASWTLSTRCASVGGRAQSDDSPTARGRQEAPRWSAPPPQGD